MSRKTYDHVHTYERIGIGKLFRCIILGCPHSISATLLTGRSARCPKCEQPFTIETKHLLYKKVKCTDCVQPKKTTKEVKQAMLAEYCKHCGPEHPKPDCPYVERLPKPSIDAMKLIAQAKKTLNNKTEGTPTNDD